jgi:Ca-activated chloride channel homolog
LFGERPIIVFGRYTKPGPISVKVTGKLGGKPWSKTVQFEAGTAGKESAVPTLWARNRVGGLSRASYIAQKASPETEITDLGLRYGILTDFTSFVAVDSRVVNKDGKPETIVVPVAVPDGMEMSSKQFGMPSGGGSGGAMMVSMRVKAASPAKGRADSAQHLKKIAPSLLAAKGEVKYVVVVKSIDRKITEELKRLKVKILKTDKKKGEIICQSDTQILKNLATIDAVLRIEEVKTK